MLIEKSYIISPQTFFAAEHCAAARVFRGPKTPPHPGMWHGIAVHRYLEYAQSRSPKAALTYIQQKFNRLAGFCANLDLSSIPKGTPEVQFIINTADELALIIESDDLKAEATARDHVIVKADLLADGEPWVIDYKTGKPKTGNALVHPSTSTQSMLEALAVWLWLNKPPRVRASIFNVTKEAITRLHHDWYAEELEAAMRRVRRVHLLTLETRAEYKVDSIVPPFEPGAHCARCDAHNVCPSSAVPADVPHVFKAAKKERSDNGDKEL